MMGWDLLSWASYWSSVVPLFVCLILWASGKNPIQEAWLISAAFLVSFVADSFAAVLALQGANNWWLSYLFAPLQFGLLIAAVTERRDVRTVALIGLGMMAVVSLTRGTLDSPETFVKVIGGAVVGLLVFDGAARRYRVPLLLYCLATAPWLLAMGAVPREHVAWLWIWAAYLLTRIAALGWMARVLVRPVLTLEVEHGPGEHQILGERRARVRSARGGARSGVATR